MLHKRLRAIRVKVKHLKEVGHTQSVAKNSVILQGTLVGHLKLFLLKDLFNKY